jgi:hypothetical protein
MGLVILVAPGQEKARAVEMGSRCRVCGDEECRL